MTGKTIKEQIEEELERLAGLNETFDDVFNRIFCDARGPTDLDKLFEEDDDEQENHEE